MTRPMFPMRAARPFERAVIGTAAAAALLLVGVSSGALAQDYNPSRLPPDQLSQVGQACEGVIRVRPGEEQYSSCVESLSESMQSVGRGRAVASARDNCLAQGFAPQSPELAECTLGAAQGAPDPTPRFESRPVREMNVPGGSRSYFAVSPGDAARREEMSCAHLGLDPTSGAFASCVANLQSAMFAADNPSP